MFYSRKVGKLRTLAYKILEERRILSKKICGKQIFFVPLQTNLRILQHTFENFVAMI